MRGNDVVADEEDEAEGDDHREPSFQQEQQHKNDSDYQRYNRHKQQQHKLE